MALPPNAETWLLKLANAHDTDTLDNNSIFVFKDSSGNLVGRCNPDGTWTFPGVTSTPMDQVLLQTGFSLSVWETIDPNQDLFIFIDVNGNIIGNIDGGTVGTEVATARGSQANLNARLSQHLTPQGSPLVGMENIGRLYTYRSVISYLKLSNSALAHVILDGDSWWDSKAYGTQQAIQRFFADSGLTNAGPGWVGCTIPFPGASTQGDGDAQISVTVTRDSNWTDLWSTVLPSAVPQNFPNYNACQATANNATITLTGASLSGLNSLRLYCGKGSSITYSWNGGSSYSSLTIASGSGSTYTSIPLSGATTTLKLQATSGSVIAGVFALTSATGVVFSNLSNSGSCAVQKAAVQSNSDYQAMMAAFPGDCKTVLIQLGLNDGGKGTATPATVVTYIGQVVAGYRQAYPSCDVMLLAQPDTAGMTVFNQDVIAPLIRQYAENNDCAFLDWQFYFGPVTTTLTTASFTGTITGTALSISGLVGSLLPGMVITGTGVTSNTAILSGSGTSYVVSISQTVSSATAMSATSTPYSAYGVGVGRQLLQTTDSRHPSTVSNTSLSTLAITGADMVCSTIANIFLSPIKAN